MLIINNDKEDKQKKLKKRNITTSFLTSLGASFLNSFLTTFFCDEFKIKGGAFGIFFFPSEFLFSEDSLDLSGRVDTSAKKIGGGKGKSRTLGLEGKFSIGGLGIILLGTGGAFVEGADCFGISGILIDGAI